MFELLGSDDDETRMLVNRDVGYALPVPGHPALLPGRSEETVRYDAIVKLNDQPMELGLRVDDVPADVDPGPLAIALAMAYATNRATEPPQVRSMEGDALARGAVAGATCLVTLREPGPAGVRTMEQLEVTIRAHATGIWVLYRTVRYPVPGINPMQWGQFRGAIRGHERWDVTGTPPPAPRLFPDSDFAHPNVTLAFTESAWDEARGKAASLPTLTDADVSNLVRTLIELTGDDAPPTLELPAFLEHLIPSRIRGLVPEDISEPLVRNFGAVKTMHDLRAWAWQCIWAIGNCGSSRDQN